MNTARLLSQFNKEYCQYHQLAASHDITIIMDWLQRLLPNQLDDEAGVGGGQFIVKEQSESTSIFVLLAEEHYKLSFLCFMALITWSCRTGLGKGFVPKPIPVMGPVILANYKFMSVIKSQLLKSNK